MDNAYATEQLHARYSGVIYDKCLRILNDAAAAEDAVQDTFLRAHLAANKPTGEMGYLPWLYRIATNSCLNMLRTRRRKWSQLADWADDRMSDNSPDAETLVIGRRLLEKLGQTLDLRSAEILVAHYIDGMSQTEIAQHLGISRRAVVKRLTNLRKVAQQILKRQANDA